jgi:hypothetical protein
MSDINDLEKNVDKAIQVLGKVERTLRDLDKVKRDVEDVIKILQKDSQQKKKDDRAKILERLQENNYSKENIANRLEVDTATLENFFEGKNDLGPKEIREMIYLCVGNGVQWEEINKLLKFL